MAFKITIVSLFPDIFPAVLQKSITGKAQQANVWELQTVNILDHGIGKWKKVDDTPYGGGAGMLMRADVVASALNQAKAMNPNAPVVFLTPSGTPFKQQKSRELSAGEGVILLCGHYEGIDQRVLDEMVDMEISIGDYVLSGGELPAMVVADAIIRNLNGALGSNASLHEESFDIQDESGNQLLEYPHYTRPEVWQGREVPAVLKSGHHAKIDQWRHEKAVEKTQKVRPELLKKSLG